MLKGLSFAMALVAAVYGGGVIYAQQKDAEGAIAVLASGDYKDMSVLRALKLSTAPFVNPALLTQTSVAFKYDPATFVSEEHWAEFVKMAGQGEVGLGVPKADGWEVVSLYDKTGWGLTETFGVEDVNALDAVELSKYATQNGIVFVALDETLLGVNPLGKIVTWNKGMPLADAAGSPVIDMEHKGGVQFYQGSKTPE